MVQKQGVPARKEEIMKVKDVVKICQTNFFIMRGEKVIYRPFYCAGYDDLLDEKVEWLDASEEGILIIGI